MYDFPADKNPETTAAQLTEQVEGKFARAQKNHSVDTTAERESVNFRVDSNVTSHPKISFDASTPSIDVQIFERFEGYVAYVDDNHGIVKLWANSQEFSRVFDREMLRKNNVDRKGLAVEVRTIIAFGNPRLTIRPLTAAPVASRGKEQFTLQDLDFAEFGDIL